jgi:hypothetical protein
VTAPKSASAAGTASRNCCCTWSVHSWLRLRHASAEALTAADREAIANRNAWTGA